ncbi:MAG: tRNA pseudouridine(38-40) synthase TruA, partial [Chitinophagaceae bacterium]
MPRYFLKIRYKGTGYAGFQTQQNAATIQGEIDKVLSLLLRTDIKTTGSSRTDAGVHALQNYVHFDFTGNVKPDLIYKMNAVLSPQIAISGIYQSSENAHARFDAVSRSYLYRIYFSKDPFLKESGYYFPYPLQGHVLNETADIIKSWTDFTSFSKRKTQVKTFQCKITTAKWEKTPGQYVFYITANRFLRGMVRGLVGTMLKTARGKITVDDFRRILASKDNRMADFSVAPQGLYLTEVIYPEG